jgi:acyl carrier protein
MSIDRGSEADGRLGSGQGDGGAAVEQAVVERKVREAVAKSLDVELQQVHLSSSLQRDFDAQSLDMLDIAFMLEREFRVQFPQTELLQRASTHFGEDELVQSGRVTDFGRELLRKGMPELDPASLQPGLRAVDVVSLITVETFVRLVLRLLDAKRQVPTDCPECGSRMRESEQMPEFVCPVCAYVTPVPSGDEILLQDLVALAHEARA